MSLSEICIKRPVFATVLSLIILTLGAIFYTKLQIRGIPDIDPPIITVSANYPGADALYMEQEITSRIEKALKNVKNIDYISSSSSVGNSNIGLFFKLSADIEIALNDVRSKISEISRSFPDDMDLPSVSKQDSDNFPSIWLTVTSDKYGVMELNKIVEDNIQDVLEKLPTVGRARIYGRESYTMRIEPVFTKMYQYKISPGEIEDVIRKQNKDYPAGTIKTNVREFTVRLNGTLNKIEDFENIILNAKEGRILRLKDVANVYLAPEEKDIILRYNGNRALGIGVIKQSKANILDLSAEIRTELEKIKKNLPDNIKINIAYDGAIAVKASINEVFKTIIEAIIFVIFVIYLFLASIRITIIPLVTIPVSLIGTFSAMYFMGFSINTFTLLAMILAIGLVVDDAIVCLENIFRHHEQGKSSIEAAMSGSKEIAFAIIAMTITLAAVFLPIGFMEGFMGKLFIEFAWTLAFCVLFSGFVALTLTPMMASRMVGKSNYSPPAFVKKFDQYLKLTQDKYLYFLNLALENKKEFLLLSSFSIVILINSFYFVNKTFVPQEDDGYLQVAFNGPEGSSVSHSEKTVIEAEKIFSNHTDIEGYFAAIGWGGGDNAFAFIPLKNWNKRAKSQDMIRNELNAKLFQIPDMSIFAMNPRSLASGNASKAIEFNLQTSREYDHIDKVSQHFLNEMKNNEIFQNIERDFKSSTPTLDIIVNRDKAYLYGTSLDNIGTTIQYLIAGKQVGDFRIGNDVYNIILQYSKGDRENVNDVKKILVKTQNTILPLEVIAKIEEKITVKSYSHYNNNRSIFISADLHPSYKITDAMNAINKIANKYLDASNTKLEYIGEISRMQESSSGMIITFLFALIFIYLVLSAQFESFGDPLIILMAVPFSITGGVVALLITGNSINIYSNIGLVTLIGLVTKNSIMIVEFANQLKEKGENIKEAILKASVLRLRPILMTSLATICGATPLIFASGAGAASRNSIGLVIVGGVLVGTIFTIFVIPVLYNIFKKA